MNPEQIKQADDKLLKTIMSFFNEGKDFWTILASQFKRVPVLDLGTVMTRITEKGVELLYDPELVLKAQKDELRYYIVHESLHIIYRHAYRFAVSEDVVDLATTKSKVPTTAKPSMPIKSSDLATDLIANRDASDVLGSHVVEKYGVTADNKLCKPLGYSNTSSRYGYSSSNEKSMYDLQSEDLDHQVVNTYTEVQVPQSQKGGGFTIVPAGGAQGQGGEGDGSGSKDNNDGTKPEDGKGNGDQDGNGHGQQKCEGQSHTDVDGKKINNHVGVDAKNPLQKQLGQRFLEDMIRAAAKQCSKDQGHLPACVQEELEMLNNPPKKDWKALLSNYINASIPAQSTRTWANLNRKFPYLLKGKKKRRVPLVGLVQDTSGSVSDAAIAAFYREIDSIRKITKTDIELVQCDSEIKEPRTISYKAKLDWKVEGRGGTEFRPALEYFDKTKRTPDVVVFFTDLQVSDSDVPDEARKYKIIWVSVDKEMCDHFASMGKYGTFIHLDVDSLDEAVSREA